MIILEDNKFLWESEELEEIKELFVQGYRPTQIASKTKNGIVDVSLAILHLMKEGEIEVE